MPAARLWFAEFSGKTVTFEIVKPYGESYPLLAAYLVEKDKILLFQSAGKQIGILLHICPYLSRQGMFPMDGEVLLVEYRDLKVPFFLLKKTEDGYR